MLRSVHEEPGAQDGHVRASPRPPAHLDVLERYRQSVVQDRPDEAVVVLAEDVVEQDFSVGLYHPLVALAFRDGDHVSSFEC